MRSVVGAGVRSWSQVILFHNGSQALHRHGKHRFFFHISGSLNMHGGVGEDDHHHTEYHPKQCTPKTHCTKRRITMATMTVLLHFFLEKYIRFSWYGFLVIDQINKRGFEIMLQAKMVLWCKYIYRNGVGIIVYYFDLISFILNVVFNFNMIRCKQSNYLYLIFCHP